MAGDKVRPTGLQYIILMGEHADSGAHEKYSFYHI